MNSGISIHTMFLEEYLQGKLKLHIVKSPAFPRKSLEMELLAHGYTSMQNKLKHYLLANQMASVAENAGKQAEVLEVSETYAYRAILETKQLCIERSDAQDNEVVCQAIHNFISDDYEEIKQAFEEYDAETKTVYFFPKLDTDSNALMSSAIQLAGKEIYGDETLSESQQRHIRRLLTQKSRKQSDTRQDLIRAAYRLKMNVAEMNEFLTKAAFTYALDFTDQWELQVAYLTEHSPVRDDDSPMIFNSKMKMLAAGLGSGHSPVWPFLNRIVDETMEKWYREWREQQELGCGAAFLMEWCWFIYIYSSEANAKKSVNKQPERRRQAEKALSDICHVLKALVMLETRQARLQFLTCEASPYMQTFINCLLDRHFRLLQLMYRHSAHKDAERIQFRIHDGDGAQEGVFMPCFREDGFVHLDRNLRKVEDTERPLSRSDIISLGIELQMTQSEIDRALTTAGFFKLYVKDIYERALTMALKEGGKAAQEENALQQMIFKMLDKLYLALSEKARTQLAKTEPEWIRRLRKNEQE